MIIAIAAAEIAFWIFLGAGLVARYVLRAKRISSILLACVPAVDVVLLTFVSIDILRGAPPSSGHAIAAVYLGVTVAFGRSIIAWADAWFRYRFDDGPRPQKPAKGSRAQVDSLWQEWRRVVLAAMIAAGGLGLMILIDGAPMPASMDEAAQQPYWSTLTGLVIIVFAWYLAGPAFAGDPTDDKNA
ncbi:hypothetical protein [Gordonia sp. CPCC 205333]|uniref:hypothetical protein n=1 Tax=Gordonia sp. CPCC 205333 TaxID=3140790 RepID=UPI003AF37120